MAEKVVLPQLQSYLSSSVAKMMELAKYKSTATNFNNTSIHSSSNSFEEDFTVNVEYLSTICSLKTDGVERDFQFYIQAVENFSELFKLSADLLCFHLSNMPAFCEYFKWMANPEIVEQHLMILRDNRTKFCSSTNLVSILLITAELERSLGNVYLLKGKQVPSCMRDLLASEELKEIFGETLMTTLQVIVGPPTSLNIRNIVWHGFVAGNEIPECAFFLISIFATCGKILARKNVKYSSITLRPPVQLEQIERLSDILPMISGENVDELRAIFEESSLLSAPMLSLYQASLNFFVEERYLESTALILTQLEHCLRRLFAAVNCCPERVLTAEADALFTTLDEILAANLEDGSPNLLLKFLGDGMMVALLDVLVQPDGPRIRDRLSHGEVQIDCVSKTISSHLICLTAALVNWDIETSINFLEDIKQKIRLYKPVFHISSTVSYEIIAACMSISTWKSLVLSCGMDLNSHSEISTALLEFDDIDHDLVLSKLIQPFSSLEAFEYRVSILSRKTLYRSRKEIEHLARLLRICRALSTTSTHVIEFLNSKKLLLDEHQLRSRQRATFQRMLVSIPCISTSCRLALFIVCQQLRHCNNVDNLPEMEYNIGKKFLKSVEAFTDNLSIMTEPTKNRWNEGSKLAEKFVQHTCNYFQGILAHC